jgi:3-oxoacyl-[acyl-carrier-protein] synthase-3
MSGIKQRHFWKPGTPPSGGAVAAGKKAIGKGSVPPGKIGCLIMCSVSRDFLEPATATLVHNQLRLPSECQVFDISNACLGILTGMITAANMIELNQVEAALLVAGENSRPLLETTIKKINSDTSITRKTIKPYFASLTIGSGAVAVLLTSKKLSRDRHRLIGGTSLAATDYNGLCRGNSDKGMEDDSDIMMSTDSETLMRRGIETAACNWEKFKEEINAGNDTFDCFCTHQVGRAHKKALFEALGIDIRKDFSTLENWGNVGSVSCPLTVAEAESAGILEKGEKLALLGIGSGINCTMLGVEW